MSNRRMLLAAFLFISPTLALADNVAHPGTPALDRPTLMSLGVILPLAGDDNYNSKVTMRYRQASASSWRDALPLYRVHPETVYAYAVSPQFAGSIFDLRPNTTYTIELHLTDSDGPIDQTFTLTATTRPVPGGPASPRIRNVNNGDELRSALVSVAPGDIVTLAPGTYTGNYAIGISGTAANPIVIRGADPNSVILDAQGADFSNIDIYSSYTQLENLTMRNATRAVNFANSGEIGNVVRRVHIVNTTRGIVGSNNQLDFYIADNVLEGRLSWPLVYNDDGGYHSDDDGIRISGFGNVIAHNRISGYGDAMKNNHWGARAFDVYGNDVLWSYDNGLELDESEGNVRAIRNRFTNVSTPLSVQPVFAGPAYIVRNVVTNAVDEQIKFHALNIASPPPQPNGVYVLQNTFVSAFQALQVQTPYGSYHTVFENNIFATSNPPAWFTVNWDAPLNDAYFNYNGYYPDNQFLFRWATGYGNYSNFAALKAAGVEPNGLLLSSGIFASGLQGTQNYRALQSPPDATLAGGSNALNNGVVLPNVNDGYTGGAPDLGALELGCPLPLYGPRAAGVDETNEPLGCDATVSAPITPPPPPAAPTGTASFVKSDTSTQGNWKSTYGAEGAIVIGDSTTLPSYASVTPSSNNFWMWSPSTGDTRALLKATSPTDRVSACWYSAGSFNIALNFTDGQQHQVALYALDWDNYFSRTETIEVVDANGAVLDSRPISNFVGGQYLVWNLSGRVTIRVSNTNAPSNAVIGGLFFGGGAVIAPPPSVSSAPVFVRADTTTQGNWKSVYGGQGSIIIGDSSAIPSYLTVTPSGIEFWPWAYSTYDSRAPLKAVSSDRIAACWYTATSMDLALNFSDGQAHQVALYALDWDNYYGRSQMVQVLDANGAVADTRTLSGFTGGQYLVWKISGKATIRITNTNGPSNAVFEGLFIDAAQ